MRTRSAGKGTEMRHKRRQKKNLNVYRAAAGLTIFFILVSCMVFYAKRNQDPAGGYRSVMDLDSLPQRINEELGRPLILGVFENTDGCELGSVERRRGNFSMSGSYVPEYRERKQAEGRATEQ